MLAPLRKEHNFKRVGVNNMSETNVCVLVDISCEKLASLLVSCLEGGSSYWMFAPAGPTHESYGRLDVRNRFGGRSARNDYAVQNGLITQEHAKRFPWASYVAPFWPGGFITIQITGEIPEGKHRSYRLDRLMMEKGMRTLANKYVRHFADILTDNDDASTADAWLQCCLFGEVIFG